MKKLLGIIVLGLLLSANTYAEDLKSGDIVTDPEIIKRLNEVIMQEHKKKFDKLYFDRYIKCTKRNFFSKNDIIYFGLPLKILDKEIHGAWDVYKYDFSTWHIMDEIDKKYYIFHKVPGVRDSLKSPVLYKIDRETGDMYELHKKINSEKKVRNCEKISYLDLPMLETKTKF